METVSVDTISETGGLKSDDCKKNLELSDKKKKRSGKKRKSRKQENELKNNDSYITSQNGNADEAVSSKERKDGETEKSTSEDQVQLSENCSFMLPSESCERDSILCKEPGATLHHKDTIIPSREDSQPDADGNGASRIRSRRREKKKKKKENISCEDKMLDDAEKTTNEDQVHPPKNSLSNSIVQEGPHKHTQDSCEKPGAAHCTVPDLSTREDSRPDANDMTCSQRRRRKKERDRNALKESGVGIHSTNADVAVKYNIISEAEGSKLMNIEEKTGDSAVINSCLKSKEDTVEQGEGTDVKLNETVPQTQSPKTKRKKKRKTKTMEVCDTLGNTLATSMQSRPVECMENNDGNAGRELMSNLASERVNSASGEENGFQNLGKTKEKKTDENTEVDEDVFGAVVCDVRSKKRKGKKKKMSSADHKTADMEVSDPSGSPLLATVESGSVECLLDHSNRKDVEICYGNTGQEFLDEDTTSKTEKSAMREKSGIHNPRKRKTKTEDENVESNPDALGAEGVTDVGRKRQKRKRKEKKNCESVANMDCESVQFLLHSNKEGVENCDGTADEGIASKDLASKIEDSATEGKSVQNFENTKKKGKDKEGKVDQDALGAEGVSKVQVKTAGDSATVGKSVQNLKNTKRKKNDKNVDQDALKTEDVSKVEGKSVQNDENTKKRKKDKKGEGGQDALGAGVSKVDVKTKKRKNKKSSLDHKTDNMEEKDKVSLPRNDEELEFNRENNETSLASTVLIHNIVAQGVAPPETKKRKKKSRKKKSSLDHKTDNMEKDDVSLPRNDEELEFNRGKHETSLSSTVLIHSNVAQGVAPPETGDVPRCSCEGQSTKKLVVFDLNGILADIVQGFTGQFVPDGKVSYRSVFLRPFVHSFLDFCFERFDIGIWSSRRIGLDYMTNLVMRNHARNLLFCFVPYEQNQMMRNAVEMGQNICTTTKFKTLEMSTKPLFLKDLRRVWERFGTCFTCGKRKYDETNTLLVDDSPDKSLCNPPHTGIFPRSYQYTDREDSELGPEGELRKYLERLADATSVQKFVAENPFGQTAITETHESWEFYSKVVEAYSK